MMENRVGLCLSAHRSVALMREFEAVRLRVLSLILKYSRRCPTTDDALAKPLSGEPACTQDDLAPSKRSYPARRHPHQLTDSVPHPAVLPQNMIEERHRHYQPYFPT